MPDACEYRVFEVDKFDNRFFLGRHSSLESAKYFLKAEAREADEAMGCSFLIEDEYGREYEL